MTTGALHQPLGLRQPHELVKAGNEALEKHAKYHGSMHSTVYESSLLSSQTICALMRGLPDHGGADLRLDRSLKYRCCLLTAQAITLGRKVAPRSQSSLFLFVCSYQRPLPNTSGDNISLSYVASLGIINEE
jgi:hypothetical protein